MNVNNDVSHRLGSSLESLNTRIARLGIALGVQLDDRLVVEKLMEKSQVPQVAVERRVSRDAASAPRLASSGDRRVAHQREELRGLLVLRYHMETISLNDHGLVMTRQILEQAEEHLVRQGFKPGADGLGLDELFNVS
jgi:hypothetical protein